MRLNKRLQYALLIVLYLCRAGRATLKHISEGLGLSFSFLREIAYSLKLGRVIKSIKGPGGGYEVSGDPTVRDVFTALKPIVGLNNREQRMYERGGAEYRALAQYALNLQAAIQPLMRRKVRTLNSDLVATEMARLEQAVYI